jgi:hypothetical protein
MDVEAKYPMKSEEHVGNNLDNFDKQIESLHTCLTDLVRPAVERIKAYGELLKLCPDSLELESRLFLRPSQGAFGHQAISSSVPQAYFQQILSFLKRNSTSDPAAAATADSALTAAATAGDATEARVRGSIAPGAHTAASAAVAAASGAAITNGQTNINMNTNANAHTGAHSSGAGAAKGRFVVSPWYTSVDFYFANDVRLTKEGTTFTWVRKQKLFNTDFIVPERPLGVRVSLKLEQKCDPVTETPLFVRTKKRCSFIDSAAHLRLDFTMVWQGRDEQEIKAQKTPDFEIEVEVTNKDFLRQTPTRSPSGPTSTTNISGAEIVSDLLVRTLELLGTESPLSICERG